MPTRNGYMTRREALQLIESALAKVAVGEGDSYSPAFVQIDPITGKITFDFTGHIKAEGLDLLAGVSATPPEDRKIRWLSESDGSVVAQLYATEFGFNSLALESLSDPDLGEDSDVWVASRQSGLASAGQYADAVLRLLSLSNLDANNTRASIEAIASAIDDDGERTFSKTLLHSGISPDLPNAGFSDWWLPSEMGAFLRKHWWTYCDFFAPVNTVDLPMIVNGDFRYDAAGAGATVINSLNQDAGVAELQTGTTATGLANIYQHNNSIQLSPVYFADPVCGWRIRIPTLSSAAQRYSVLIGFGFNDPLNPIRAAAFRYSDNINAGKWQAITANDTPTLNTQDTGIAVDTNWHWLEVKTRPRPTSLESVEFYIDGTLVATISGSGILSNYTQMFCVIRKSVGTTGRELFVDAAYAFGNLDR